MSRISKTRPTTPTIEDTNMPTTDAPEATAPSLRILKKATCPKLSSRASGQLTYHIGVDADGSISFRITGNEGGGFFSNEYVALSAIQEEVASHGDAAFKALAFRPLFRARALELAVWCCRIRNDFGNRELRLEEVLNTRNDSRIKA